MASAILTFVLILFIGGLGLIAQYGRKSRQAAIALIVVLFASSVLVTLAGAFAGLGLLVISGDSGFSAGERTAFIVSGAVAVLAGLVGIALCVPPFLRLIGRPVRRETWTDPPFVLGAWLAVMLLVNNAVGFLLFTQSDDLATLFPGGRVSPLTVLLNELPLIILAVMGVGIFVRRSPRQTLQRLGYGRISLANLGVVAVFVIGAVALSVAADALFAALQPDLYSRVGELSDSLFSPQGLGPVSAILFAVLIGVGAGLGEETLFRGALQPTLGIAFTSVLFASMHIQYGPSLLLGYIFLLAIGLGFLRKRINTTASFIAHASYNALGVLLSYFFGM